jgi:hypothetical protein
MQKIMEKRGNSLDDSLIKKHGLNEAKNGSACPQQFLWHTTFICGI